MSVDHVRPPDPVSARRVARGGLWSSLSLYWRVAFGFACSVALTRMLTPETFGEFAYALFFVGLIHIQPRLGLRVPFLQGQDDTAESLGTYVVLETLAALAALPLLLVALPLLPASVRTIVCVMTMFFVAQGIVGALGTLLERELRLGTTAGIQVLAFTLSYLAALWLAARGGGVWALVSQPVTQGVVGSVALLWTLRRQVPAVWASLHRFRPELARRFVRTSATVGAGGVAGGLSATVDNFLVATFSGTTALGYYDRAYRTAQWPALLLGGVASQNAFLTYSRLKDENDRLQRAVDMLLWVITTCAFPVALVLIITGPDLIVLLYGEQWRPAAPLFRILAVVFAIGPLWDHSASFLVAMGDTRANTAIALVRLAIIVGLGAPLTMGWGALGTCVAVGMGSTVAAALITHRMTRHVDVAWFQRLAVPALVACVTIAGAVLLNRTAPINTLAIAARVGIKAAYAVGAFFALTCLAQPRASRERFMYVWHLLVNR